MERHRPEKLLNTAIFSGFRKKNLDSDAISFAKCAKRGQDYH